MRLPYLLLVAAALLAVSNAQPTEAQVTRSLRSHRTVDSIDAQEEERGGGAFTYKFDFNTLDDIFKALPEQFQRMRNEPEYLRYIFNSWKSGMGTTAGAVQFMKYQGLSEKAITQFEAAFKAYLLYHATT